MARSNKTMKVMNLIAPESYIVIPEQLNEKIAVQEPEQEQEPVKPKKSRRRTILKHIELNTDAAVASPLLPPPPQNDSKTVYVKPAGERQVVNVIALLINEQLGVALERFNVCSCPKCCLEITVRAMRELPPVFVQVVTIDDANTVNAEINRYRSDVIKTLTKLIMAARITPYHKFYTDFT